MRVKEFYHVLLPEEVLCLQFISFKGWLLLFRRTMRTPDLSRRLFPLNWIFVNLIFLFHFCTHIFEPRSEKTGLQDFRPGPTQIRRWLEA